MTDKFSQLTDADIREWSLQKLQLNFDKRGLKLSDGDYTKMKKRMRAELINRKNQKLIVDDTIYEPKIEKVTALASATKTPIERANRISAFTYETGTMNFRNKTSSTATVPEPFIRLRLNSENIMAVDPKIDSTKYAVVLNINENSRGDSEPSYRPAMILSTSNKQTEILKLLLNPRLHQYIVTHVDARIKTKERNVDFMLIAFEKLNKLIQGDTIARLFPFKHALWNTTVYLTNLADIVLGDEVNVERKLSNKNINETNFPKTTSVFNIGLSPNARNQGDAETKMLNFQLTIMKPGDSKDQRANNMILDQWIEWLKLDRQNRNAKKQLENDIKNGDRKPRNVKNGHDFILSVPVARTNDLSESINTLHLPKCAIKKKEIFGPYYKCQLCGFAICAQYIDDDRLFTCRVNKENATQDRIPGTKHKLEKVKYREREIIKCSHSGELIELDETCFRCLECEQHFKYKYAKDDLLPPTCFDIYSELKLIDDSKHEIYTNIKPSIPSFVTSFEDQYTTVVKEPIKKPVLEIVRATSQVSQTIDQVEFIGELDIKDFDLIKRLGRGAFGLVLGAKHKTMKSITYAAIKVADKKKVLSSGCFDQDDEPVDLINEQHCLKLCTEAFKSGKCQNVVSFYGCWQDENRCYIAMEYLPNYTLDYHISERADRDTNLLFCRYYGTEIARGVTFLHTQNIVHRDLKPENIALDKFGHARLIDFGMVRLNINKFKADSLCGSPPYMCYDILDAFEGGRPYGVEVDWWSIGCIIYYMFLHIDIFNGRDNEAVYQEIRTKNLGFHIGGRHRSRIERRHKKYDTESSCEDLIDVIAKTVVRDHKKRLSWRKNQTDGEQPLEKHRFFRNGAQLIDQSGFLPPINRGFLTSGDVKDAETGMYENLMGPSKYRRNKSKKLLVSCYDDIREKDDWKFRNFGVVL